MVIEIRCYTRYRESDYYILATGLYRLGKTCYLHSLLCNNSVIKETNDFILTFSYKLNI